MRVRAGGIEVVVEGLKRNNVSLVVACVVVLRC
jgi:hypothetical protein